ncbi:beta-galactosidase GalB [Terrimicrobium sacchariphilum]|nr:beta-galactosidase GalB [Terrimicrobium sacchariphilum]
MKKILMNFLTMVATLLVGFPMLGGAVEAAETQARERSSFNADWRFIKGDPEEVGDTFRLPEINKWLASQRSEYEVGKTALRPEGNLGAAVSYVAPGFDDGSWRKLNLPHDWGIEGPFNQEYDGETGKLPWWGVAWYRKHFEVPAADRGSQLYLDFDGAMSYALVWVNGKFAGGWPYGYSSFRVDITPYVNFGGENVVAVRLDNPPNSSRWYPGGGIYRNVWLVRTSPVHVAHWGTQVTTPQISAAVGKVELKTSVVNNTEAPASVSLKNSIYVLDRAGAKVGKAVASGATPPLSIAPGERKEIPAQLAVPRPDLWSPETPARYVVVTDVLQGNNVVDQYETPLGFRTIAYHAKDGFMLNGKPYKFQGVCNHHDLGALGTAVNYRALERQVELLKEMGGNAIRTSHNPPAPELLEICDRLGMLVMVEAFDCWASGKKPNDYGRLFKEWHEADLRAMVRRDRNHPSVVIWSTGNEIAEQNGPWLSEKLTRIVHEEDSTRPVSVGCNWLEAGFNGFQKSVDIFGFNYKPGVYERFHNENPDIPIYGSETASTISTRGEYFFPLDHGGQSDFQMSSYDLYFPGWATTPDTEFKAQDKYPYVMGEFVWTGFDYLGEPTPYNKDTTNLLNMADPEAKAKLKEELDRLGKIQVPSRSSYFGILDLAGFKKDRFYIYQAKWRPDFPMAHILPHWNWPDRIGQVTPVHVYTSGDEAELFLNGKSLGRKKKEAGQYRLRWDDVKYEPGELRVVAYKNGRQWAEDKVVTTGEASQLALSPDRARISADGKDLSFVTVKVEDGKGRVVPRSGNEVKFEISGPGELDAVDNGNPVSHESFQASERKAFNGLALAIVRSKPGEKGEIKLKAVSAGLVAAETTISAE